MTTPCPAAGVRKFSVHLQKGNKRHEIQASQVTVENLRKLFKIDPTLAWLSDEFDDTVYLASEDGKFDLSDVTAGCYLNVEGPEELPAMSRPTTLVSTPGPSSLPSPHPNFRSVIPVAKKPTTFSLKVYRAAIEWKEKGKPVFHPESQTFIELREDTANMNYIMSQVRSTWPEEELFLVTNDGVQLQDSPGTKGLSFWKSPRRKIYAVTTKKMASLGKRKKRASVISSDDDDFEPDYSASKRARMSSKIDILLEDMDLVKRSIDSIFSLTKASKIPLGFKRIFKDTIQCAICMTLPIKPPLIITKCCKRVLGCEECTNKWYSGPEALTKPCPLCKTARGYTETMILKGLDNFLNGVANLEIEDCESEDLPD